MEIAIRNQELEITSLGASLAGHTVRETASVLVRFNHIGCVIRFVESFSC
jgi:hypothetical protein